MEKLTYKYENACNAAARLQEMLAEFKNAKPDTVQYEAWRDSVIKRFEFTLDTFWKFLRSYLIIKHGFSAELPGSKAVFKAALESGILPSGQASVYYAMVDDRNKTSHTYDSALAQEIVSRIPKYWSVIDAILQKHKIYITEDM